MKKSLASLLNENRIALERDLSRSDDTRKAIVEVDQCIDRVQTDYSLELTVHQIPVAASMLHVVRSTLGSLEATCAEVWERPTKLSSRPPRTAGRPEGLLAAKAGQLLLAAALIMTLISSQSWTGLVLATLLVGSETLVQLRTCWPGVWFSSLLRGRGAEAVATADLGQSTTERRGVVRVIPRELVNCLEKTLSVIDDVVDQAPPPPAPSPQAREIEKQFPDVIDLFYELLGARSLNDDAGLRRLLGGRLAQVLRQAGIDVVCYPPPTGRSAEQLFELQQSNEPEVNPHMLMYPALAREDRVVRKGRVLVPVA